jgi:hypothetical protein
MGSRPPLSVVGGGSTTPPRGLQGWCDHPQCSAKVATKIYFEVFFKIIIIIIISIIPPFFLFVFINLEYFKNFDSISMKESCFITELKDMNGYLNYSNSLYSSKNRNFL